MLVSETVKRPEPKNLAVTPNSSPASGTMMPNTAPPQDRVSEQAVAKSVLFKCGRCLGLVTISDPSLLTVYEGHFYCIRCRKAGGDRCADQLEERALHLEEVFSRPARQ